MTETMTKEARGFRLLLGYLGIFITLAGVIQLLALTGLFFNPEESTYVYHFLIPGLSSVLMGLLLSRLLKNRRIQRFERYEDAIFLCLMWLVVIVSSSMPFMIYGADF